MNPQPAITFPQYRKYSNGKAYFKIFSSDTWEEIRITGTHCTLHQFQAKILPERNFLNDMLFHFEKNWLLSDEREFEEKKKLCEKST